MNPRALIPRALRRTPSGVGRSLALVAVILATAGCGPGSMGSDADFRITYRALPVAGVSPTSDDMELIRSIIQQRLDSIGLATVRVGVGEPDRIIVEAAPAGAAETVRTLAGATGRLDFVPLGNTAVAPGDEIDLDVHRPLFSGDQVAGASIASDPEGRRTVDITLADEGRLLLAEHTTDHVGEYMALMLDGRVIVAPLVTEPITGGQIQVSQGGANGYGLEEAQNLVTILRFGQSPFPLQEIAFEER